MKYEGMYNDLITKRNNFISDSVKTKSKLESELRLLEAELKLYTECCERSMSQNYDNLRFEANDKCNKKLDEIKTLDEKVKNANQEITVLSQLIELEIANENSIKV